MDKTKRISLTDRQCGILTQALYRQIAPDVTAIELLSLMEKLATSKPSEPKVRRRRRMLATAESGAI